MQPLRDTTPRPSHVLPHMRRTTTIKGGTESAEQTTHVAKDNLLSPNGGARVNGIGRSRTRRPRPDDSHPERDELRNPNAVHDLHSDPRDHFHPDPTLHRYRGVIHNALSRATARMVRRAVLRLPVQPLHVQRRPTGNRYRLLDR